MFCDVRSNNVCIFPSIKEIKRNECIVSSILITEVHRTGSIISLFFAITILESSKCDQSR